MINYLCSIRWIWMVQKECGSSPTIKCLVQRILKLKSLRIQKTSCNLLLMDVRSIKLQLEKTQIWSLFVDNVCIFAYGQTGSGKVKSLYIHLIPTVFKHFCTRRLQWQEWILHRVLPRVPLNISSSSLRMAKRTTKWPCRPTFLNCTMILWLIFCFSLIIPPRFANLCDFSSLFNKLYYYFRKLLPN